MNAATLALNPGLFPTAPATPPVVERTNRTNTGKGFELEIERTAGAYHSKRQAVLRKVDPPVAIIWPVDKATGKRVQRVIFKRNSFTDFVGCLMPSGRALFVECKSTSTHRLGLRDGQLSPDQRAAMHTWRGAGASVCVLWQWAGKVALFTPEMIAEAEARGDKSLVFASGRPVPRGEGSVLWDFLAVLEGNP